MKVKKAIEKGNMEGAKIYAQNAIRKKNEQLNYMKLASRLDAVVSRLDTQAKMQMVTKSMSSIVKSLEGALASNNLEKIAATMGQFEKQFENLDLQTQVVDEVMGAQANLSTPEDEVNSLIMQVRSNANTHTHTHDARTHTNTHTRTYTAQHMQEHACSTWRHAVTLCFVHQDSRGAASCADPGRGVLLAVFVPQVADEHNLDVALGMANAPQGGPSKVKQDTQEDDLGARLAELRGK